jgi:hypothetical protein
VPADAQVWRSSADIACIFYSASTDPMPLDKIHSQSRLISPTPTLQHHLQANESWYCRFSFLFYLFLLVLWHLDFDVVHIYTKSFHLSYFFQSLFLLSTCHIFLPVFIILILAFLSVSCSQTFLWDCGMCVCQQPVWHEKSAESFTHCKLPSVLTASVV